MNLRDLRYLVALAQHAHFGRAAVACHVSQPTLSAQIAKLEAQLGVVIFERTGKSVRLSTVGTDILSCAQRAVEAADEIVSVARASKDPLHGPIRLGVIPTLAPYIAPYLLPRAAAEMPQAPLLLVEDFTERVMAMLGAGELDAVLIATEPELPRLEQRFVFDEPLQLVTAAGHELTRSRRVPAALIDGRKLLLLTDGHCLRNQVLDLCNTARGGPAADLKASSLETLLHLTAAGYGVTLVPMLAWLARGVHDKRLASRPIEGNPVRRVRLVWRERAPRAAAFEKLAQIVRSCVPQMLRARHKRNQTGAEKAGAGQR